MILFTSFILLFSYTIDDDIFGEWTAKLRGDRIYLRMEMSEAGSNRYSGNWGHWSSSNYYAREEFKGLEINKEISFTLDRDAGSIIFSGSFIGRQYWKTIGKGGRCTTFTR